MKPWLRTLLQGLYVLLGGLIAGGGAVTLSSFRGCTSPPIVSPPVPPPPPAPTNPVDPVGATAQFFMRGTGCTCTVLADRPSPGKYYLLCAAHCVRGGPGNGQAKLKNGQILQWTLVRTNEKSDLSLLIADGPDGLPVAKIAPDEPTPGTVIWHQGYGVDRPGNLETGRIVDGPDSNGQLKMVLNVSSGDSGSGIFRKDTGEIVSVVCCGNRSNTWGGGVRAIRGLITRTTEYLFGLPEWNPLPVPPYDGTK